MYTKDFAVVNHHFRVQAVAITKACGDRAAPMIYSAVDPA
jgi:hypothetical protein